MNQLSLGVWEVCFRNTVPPCSPQIPKFTDAQVPYIKWHSAVHPLYPWRQNTWMYLNTSVCIWTQVVLNVELTTSSFLSFDNVSPQSFSALPLLTFWVRCQMVCCGRVGFYFILAWLVVSLSSALYASDILSPCFKTKSTCRHCQMFGRQNCPIPTHVRNHSGCFGTNHLKV